MIRLDPFEDYISSKSPEEVLELVQKYFDGYEVEFPEKINWDGFAFSAAMKARGSYAEGVDSQDLNLTWAKIAVRVYKFLAVSSKAKDSFENSSMTLRSFMISHLGHVDLDPILDSRNIIEWFMEKLEFSSYDEICAKATFWEEFFSKDVESKNPNEKIDFHEVLKLRRLKERLSIIRTLTKGENVILSDEINRLLEIREKLP